MITKKSETVSLGTLHFTVANERIRDALEHADVVKAENVFAQRYIGCGMEKGKSLKIFGVPGNDTACYMDGGSIEVFGNAQDQLGNTMNEGTIIIHGRSGDATGYAMRGGRIFIRDGCGWRAGIHMKQYQDKRPTIVIGGDAGSFLGEYMAGGIILLLGKVGDYLATGMHGGVIYLRKPLEEGSVPEGLTQEAVDKDDQIVIADLLSDYNTFFAKELEEVVDANPKDFYRIKPASSRPYESMYAS